MAETVYVFAVKVFTNFFEMEYVRAWFSTEEKARLWAKDQRKKSVGSGVIIERIELDNPKAEFLGRED